MTKKAALGRGFDGLIPIGMDVASVATPGEQVKQINVNSIHPNKDQPRKTFDESALAELATSIKQHGIIQPLVVTPDKTGYRIVAGERRWRAAQKAKLKQVPVIIRNHEELEELEIALVENVQRVDLSPLEQAVSIAKLHDQFSLSMHDIATKLGKAQSTVSNVLRLLQLPQEAIEAMQKNIISEGHARAILALKTDEKLQIELLNNIITQNLTVREAERFVLDKKQGRPAKVAKLRAETEKIYQSMPAANRKRVKIIEKGKGGRVTIKYNSIEELQAILSELN